MDNYRPQSAQSSNKKSQQSQNIPQPVEDLEEYMDILFEHQKNCEKTGKYQEAEIAKKRILELKKEFDKKNKEEIHLRHQGEREEIERAHLNEFHEFNDFWDNKMNEFQQEAARVEQETMEKQNQEINQFAEELERSIPLKPKDNTQVMNLKKIEEQLAKQEQYTEAHKVQSQCQKIEKDEIEKWYLQRNIKIKNLINQLKTKQNNELNALRQRIESGKEEQRKIRSIELEKLLQKYSNVRKDLDGSHNGELSKLDKMIKNGSMMNTSKMINSSKIANSSMQKSYKQ